MQELPNYLFNDTREGWIEGEGRESVCWWTGASLVGGVSWDQGNGRPRAVWSGSAAELDRGGMFEADPRTWSARGWAALEGVCGRIRAEGAESGIGEVWIRPHARHVLSDVPSCSRFAREWCGAESGPTRFRLLWDPASMLTREMVEGGAADDHLKRLYGALESPSLAGAAAAVIVANVTLDEGRGGLRASPIEVGMLDGRMIEEFGLAATGAGLAIVTFRGENA